MNWLPLQNVAQTAVERIFNALPEGFLIALFAWALLRVLRRQNSGTRFAVWFLALLTVAALPVLGGFGAGQGRALTAAGMSSAISSGKLGPTITIPGRWALVAFLAWVLGACLAMVRLATGLWRLRQLRRSCTAIVAADLDPAVRKTIDRMDASVTVAASERVRVPAAIGFWKRTIVLPTWALRELPPSDLNVILLHEFAHLRRWDDWTNLIQKIVRALFFFHPAVWWIENRLSVEREMACDDAVLAETANPHGYATCLVSLLEKSLAHRLMDKRLAHKQWSMAQAAVHRAREASLRLAEILDINRPVATRVWKPALGMAGAFSMVCLALLLHAPQFVAVDRGALASSSAHVYSAAVSQPASLSLPSIVGAPGILARLDERDARHSTTRSHAVARRQLVPARVVAARLNAAPPPDRVVAVSASADREVAPEFRTLVFIEATQYIMPDSSVWRIQVWRVTLVNPIPDRFTGVPAANKT